MILLLTDGGTPLEAMQRYGPMCSLFTLVMLNVLPSMEGAGTKNVKNKDQYHTTYRIQISVNKQSYLCYVMMLYVHLISLFE